MKIGSKKRVPKKPLKSKRVEKTKKIKDKKDPLRHTDNRSRGEKWLILQVRDDHNISDDYDNIKRELLNNCEPNIEFYIPTYVEKIENKPVSMVLFDGYVFVKCLNFNQDDLEYIKGPLVSGGKQQYVYDKDIDAFKNRLQSDIVESIPEKGQKVIPKVGVFRNLEGEVLSVNRKKLLARIIFKQASRIVQANISIVNLEIINE